MPNENVVKAYESLISDLESFAARLSGERGSFISGGEFETARVLVNADRKLLALAQELSRHRDAFVRQLGGTAQAISGNARSAPVDPNPGRAARTRLKVTFPDGLVIQEETAALTFALVIERLGMEQVASLGWRVNSEPLMSRHQSQNYYQEKVGSWFIMTHSNTNYKKRILDGLAMQLGVPIRVEIIH